MSIINDQMEHLSDHIGTQVTVEYANYGDLRRETGQLREVCPYLNLLVGSSGLPFIGYGSAIRRVYIELSNADFDVIYLNPFIPVDYDIRNDDDAREAITRLAFGDAIADEQKARRLKDKADWDARMAELDNEAVARAPSLMETGAALVKPELADEWRQYAETNSQDGYSGAVVEGTVQALQALADGKTPEEAEKACTAAETGFQFGCMAKGLSRFAPRGDEWRAYWNRKYVSEERAAEADTSGGVANPAILTIGN